MDVMSIKYDSKLDNSILFLAAKEGDQEAKELFYKNNIPFVRHMAQKWIKRGWTESIEELMSLGFIGLTKAFRNYDPSRNVKFTSYLGYVISGIYKLNARKTSKEKYTKYETVSLNEKIEHDSDLTFSEIVADDSMVEFNMYSFDVERIDRIVKEIATDKEKDIYQKHYWENKSLSLIAQEYGQTRAATSRVHRILIGKIKDALR